MLKTSKIYFDEIEDRLDAPFYQEFYMNPIRNLNLKGVQTDNLEEFIKTTANGVEIRRYVDEGTPYLRVSDMKSIFVSLSAVKYVKENISEVSKEIKLEKDNVLISRSGTPGITAIVNKKIINSIISSHIIKVVIKKELLNPYFLTAYLNSFLGRLQVDRITNGCLVSEISHQALGMIKVPVPTIKQQEGIASLLMEAGKKNQEAVSKIEEAKSIFVKALEINPGIRNEGKTYKVDSSDLTNILIPRFYDPRYLNVLKRIRKKFRTVKLGEIANIRRGDEVGSKNYRRYVEKDNSDVPFIRTSDLINYEIDNYPDFYIKNEIYEKKKQALKPGDLLISNDGKIGLLAILTNEDKCVIQSHIRKVHVNKELNPYYILAFLATDFGHYQFKQYTFTQATIPTISDRLAEIEIPVISKSLLIKISELVEESFKMKEEKKRLCAEALWKVEHSFN